MTPAGPAVRYVRTEGRTLAWLSHQRLALLSPEERAAFDRLKPPTSRRDYLAAHLAVRISVARSLAVAPREVGLSYDANGRPLVVGAGAPIQISLTHCQGLGACAVSAVGDTVPIGIDAEPLSAASRVDEIRDLVLTRAEQDWAGSVGAEERNARLIALWTAKEAVLKARGVGVPGSSAGNGMLQVDCRPGPWQAGCAGWFSTPTERVRTVHLPGDHCLAWARSGAEALDHPVPEELVFPTAAS